MKLGDRVVVARCADTYNAEQIGRLATVITVFESGAVGLLFDADRVPVLCLPGELSRVFDTVPQESP